MATKTKYAALKNELKELAEEIRTSKTAHKQSQRDWDAHRTWVDNTSPRPRMDWSICYRQNDLYSGRLNLSHRYRHLLIAYSLLRGKSYEQVERKVSQHKFGHPFGPNTPDMEWVGQIMDEHRSALEAAHETVCAG